MGLIGGSSKGSLITLIILGIIIIGGVTFVGGLTPQEKKPTKNYPIEGELEAFTDSKKEQGLQLKTLKLKKVAPITKAPRPPNPTTNPTPTVNACPFDNGIPITDINCKCVAWKVLCENNKCVNVIVGTDISGRIQSCDIPPGRAKFDKWCQNDRLTPTDGRYCLAKPVIYLYPEKETLVDVSVETEGKIVVSDPHYPPGGWKNVLAYPSGKLIYQGKEYRELFYESETPTIKIPEEGLVVKKEDIGQALINLNKRLGLTEFESKELTGFWIPRLRNLSSPYIVISLIEGKEKDRIDKIYIDPKPDTLIEVLYYFRPVDKIIDIKPLRLSPTPERIGFIAVEWGGTIDYEK